MGMGAARKNKAKGYKQTTSIKRELVWSFDTIIDQHGWRMSEKERDGMEEERGRRRWRRERWSCCDANDSKTRWPFPLYIFLTSFAFQLTQLTSPPKPQLTLFFFLFVLPFFPLSGQLVSSGPREIKKFRPPYLHRIMPSSPWFLAVHSWANLFFPFCECRLNR
jgi:hypothetical protein